MLWCFKFRNFPASNGFMLRWTCSKHNDNVMNDMVIWPMKESHAKFPIVIMWWSINLLPRLVPCLQLIAFVFNFVNLILILYVCMVIATAYKFGYCRLGIISISIYVYIWEAKPLIVVIFFYHWTKGDQCWRRDPTMIARQSSRALIGLKNIDKYVGHMLTVS